MLSCQCELVEQERSLKLVVTLATSRHICCHHNYAAVLWLLEKEKYICWTSAIFLHLVVFVEHRTVGFSVFTRDRVYKVQEGSSNGELYGNLMSTIRYICVTPEFLNVTLFNSPFMARKCLGYGGPNFRVNCQQFKWDHQVNFFPLILQFLSRHSLLALHFSLFFFNSSVLHHTICSVHSVDILSQRFFCKMLLHQKQIRYWL